MKIDEGVRVLESRVRACVIAAFCSYLGSHSQQDAYQWIFSKLARVEARELDRARCGASPACTLLPSPREARG